MGTYNIPYIGFKRFGEPKSHSNISVKHGYKRFEHERVKNKAYYSHPIGLYYTEQENEDLKYIVRLGYEAVNPRELEYEDFFGYVDELRKCDVVFFRGYTSGVVVEVLAALAFRKPVFSLNTNKPIDGEELDFIVDSFNESDFRYRDLERFKLRYPRYFRRFQAVVGVQHG